MKRILVVDDDAMNLRMSTFILGQKEYEVITAASGQDCLDMLKTESVDLILLDVEMPEMNGIETLEQIRKQQAFCNLPVMFLTADTNEETMAAAERLGAVGYVKKPYIPQEFLEKVGNVL